MSSAAVGVLVVDDQETFRRAAGELIAATPGFVQVGEAASGAEAIVLAASVHPDLVLIEVRLHVMDGIETARRLTCAEPGVVVVLMSIEASGNLPSSVLSAGAAAHLRKQDLTPARLRDLWTAHGPGVPAAHPQT